MCFFCVYLWSESATTLRQDWTDTCVLEPCKNDASEREERKSPNPGKRSAKRSVRVYAANCDCVTCLSKGRAAAINLRLERWEKCSRTDLCSRGGGPWGSEKSLFGLLWGRPPFTPFLVIFRVTFSTSNKKSEFRGL